MTLRVRPIKNHDSLRNRGHVNGGGGYRTPIESTGKTDASKVRGTPALRLDQMPNIVAHASEALNNLIEWWPSLSLATQNRLYAIAETEATSNAKTAQSMRGVQ